MKYQLCMETLLQMLKLTQPNSSDPKDSPQASPSPQQGEEKLHTEILEELQTHPQTQHRGVPRLTVWLASTDCRHLDAKRPLVMVWLKLLRSTPLLSETNRRQGRASPEQKAKFALHKNKQDSSRIHFFTP